MDRIDLTQSKDVIGAFNSQNYDDVLKKYDDPGTKYAMSVLTGKQVAGYKMQLACFRHMQDLRRSENKIDNFNYTYNLDKAQVILNFAKVCPDVDAGKPLPLMSWQQFILCMVSGWRDSYGDKRFTEAHISVGRKQGKTYITAILSAYSFLIEGYGFYNQDYLVASNTADQTTKLYGYVAGMISYLISNNPVFAGIAKEETIDVQANKIIAKKVTNRLVKISNESGKFDSYHFTSAIYDEAGDEKAGRYTSRIITGQSDVKNHQFIKISTAYEFLGTEFYNDIKRGVQAMEQDYKRSSDNELCLVWDQDNENEVYKPETWIKSNPLIGMSGLHDKKIHDLTILRDTMIAQGKINEFQNKNMNIYLQVNKDSYLKLKDVEAAIISKFDVQGRQVYIGYDYSMFSDNTAVAFVFPYDNGKWHVVQHSFIPWQKAGSIDVKEKQDGLNYRELAKQGFCTITSHPQGLINDEQVYKWVLSYVDHFNLDVLFFGYDAWGATTAIKQMELNTSWPLEAIRQRTSELKDPTKFLQTGFVEGSITRYNDPIMEKALLNAVVKADAIGIQVDKSKATLKIDVVDAVIDAMYQAMYHFEDFATVNDKSKQVERMTPDQLKEWLLSGKFGF